MAERGRPPGDRPRNDRPREDRPRGDRPYGKSSGGGKPRSDRPTGNYRRADSRPSDQSSDRPRRDYSAQPRGDSSKPRREYPDKPQRDFSDRPRPDYRDKPRRDYSDRPRADFSEKPRRELSERMSGDDAPKPRRDYSDRTPTNYSDRPRREYSARPRSNFSDRPRGDFPDRPRRDFSDRTRDERQREDRPRDDRTRDDRPRDDRPRGNFADRARPYGDRPRRAPFDARRPYTARAGYAARPQHEPAVDRDALVGEGEELIAGRRPVEEAFAARRDSVRLLIVPERRAALDALAIHATTLRIPVVEVEGGTLTALAGFDGHQGVALVARPRVPGDVDAILARARERGEAPFVLVLDSLEDPQNFGTLLRSAEACGVHGVIYPTRRSAPLSPAAIKASAGATEHLVLAAVDDLAATLADLHSDGLRIAGADEKASLSYVDADLRGPLAIVVGSEGRGMSGPVHRRLDVTVRIPMRGKIGSLNAAVAGSVLLFAAAGQRPAQPDQGSPTEAPPSEAVGEFPELPLKPKRVRRPKVAVEPEPQPEELLPDQ